MSFSNRNRDSYFGKEYDSELPANLPSKSPSKLSSRQEPELHCKLCDRSVATLTAHHLTPRQKTKRKNLDPGPTIQICSACHRQIHVLYDNSYLAKELNTLEKLQQDPKMQRFIAWVRKQDPGKKVQVDRRYG
ncbi:hypothetical protein [Leptolyngbya ohadii]|uniref:hypothetical protein n=1 Tax=Leptolyngbya ohadii TaxID=1962290 RepID=UPI0021F154E9|nr:hypothetical protein [Leptolyngbya ohadii]